MNLTDAARRVLRGETGDPQVWHLLNRGSDDNGRKYYLLLSAVGQADLLRHVPDLLKRVITTEAWKEWQWMGATFRSQSLGAYLTTKPPKGIGASLGMVERLIEDDADALTMFRRETTRARHRPASGSSDIVTTSPTRGNSRAYTLDRLQREEPDLFARVQRNELSANAAAIQAGFREKPTVLATLRRAWARASSEDREAFLREVTNERGGSHDTNNRSVPATIIREV